MMTTSERVYLEIRDLLGTGDLTPGRRVAQSDLAKQLGCSTIPVIEALRRLESEGLLRKKPRRMATVRALSPRDWEGLYYARIGLETVAARFCAQRISEPDLARLVEIEQRLIEAAKADDRVGICRLESELHGLIAAAADCALIEEELNRLMLIERTAGCWDIPTRREDLMVAHRALIQAITDQDAESAEYFMRKHIENGLKERLETLEKVAP
jgi:DNA-binding GntR family transcriptional regulator